MPDRWPRGLRERDAAEYVGLSATVFRQVVKPVVPATRLTPGRIVWLREKLDAWLDRVDGAVPTGNPAPDPETQHDPDPIAAALASLATKGRARRPHKAG